MHKCCTLPSAERMSTPVLPSSFPPDWLMTPSHGYLTWNPSAPVSRPQVHSNLTPSHLWLSFFFLIFFLSVSLCYLPFSVIVIPRTPLYTPAILIYFLKCQVWNKYKDYSGSPVADSMFPIQGAQLQPLMGELDPTCKDLMCCNED